MAELSALKESVQPKAKAKPSSLGGLKIAAEEAPQQQARSAPAPANILQYVTYTIAAIMTFAWVGLCISYAFGHDIPTDPASLGMYLSGVFAPPALFWMLITAIAKAGQGSSTQAAPRMPSPQASQDALQSLAAISHQVKADIRELNTLAQTTEKRVTRLSQDLSQRSLKLRDLITEIEQRSASIDDRSQQGAESWDAATLHILERAAEIENTILNGADKITSAADSAEAQIAGIGTKLDERFEGLSVAANKINTRIKSINTGFKAGTKNIATCTAQLEKEAARLDGATKQSVNSMIHTTDLLRDYGDRLDDNMRSMTTQVDYISDALGTSMIRMEEALDDVAQKTTATDEFTDSLSAYSEKHLSLLQSADMVVEESLAKLEATTEKIAEEISSEILSAAQAARDLFADTSNEEAELDIFHEEPERPLIAPNPPMTAERPEQLPENIEFIIEHLHSIAMDIARVAEGSVSERTWKAYQGGNIAAFTQRLQALPKILPLPKARKKYQGDAEFQTYTNRFITEFEDMRASVPMNAIIPLDLETLYSYLRKIAGR
ncbi:MAG: hypothetical protein ACRBCT_00655 [Alphaproteobacteria bacterium]